MNLSYSLIEINQNVTCSCLQLAFRVFAIIRSNFNYFGHSCDYDMIIEIFIL
jgi:hypothetical protein